MSSYVIGILLAYDQVHCNGKNYQFISPYFAYRKLTRDLGWEWEEALDIEYAHAMPPNATLYLVEAASASDSALLAAVTKASQLVAKAGGGQVSMSWGGAEFNGHTSWPATSAG